jgi:hypothetical protein
MKKTKKRKEKREKRKVLAPSVMINEIQATSVEAQNYF